MLSGSDINWAASLHACRQPFVTKAALAQVVGLKPGEFIHPFGNLHFYSNHVAKAKLQLTREPRTLPTMEINPAVKNIHDFKFEDFEIVGYNPHPAIKAPIAI